jgi:hypothetical protein
MKLSDDIKIRDLAKELGLGKSRNPVKAIQHHCENKITQIIEQFPDEIHDLNQLLDVVSSSLGVRFEEVHTSKDLERIRETYLSLGELIFANLNEELNAKTDAVLIRRNYAKEWEPKYVAVIDCRGHKGWRAYFSKWHEIAHVLTTPSQTCFQFRRTPSKKKDPLERIVDRIAGYHAFYEPIFYPYLEKELESSGTLTFQCIENLKESICFGASREATARGAVIQCAHPQLFLIADYGFKAAELREMNSPFASLFPDTEPIFESKLRAVDVIGNEAANDAGLRIHRNMEVPSDSVITEAYESISTIDPLSADENLNWWKHSRGRLDDRPIYVEAIKTGERAYALISEIIR